ncbi:PAS domain S-box protein [Halomicrococcus sp. NG-SE-24]|uniref:PAS domain S-box protein n=1 Tax=Halomicrococcus sp. NG-SE-24 TaxID=3436928 RepID=UPI003D97E44F
MREQFARTVLEESPDPVVVVDDGRVTYANRAAATTLGRDPDSLRGATAPDLFDGWPDPDTLARSAREGSSLPLTIRRSGERVALSCSLQTFDDDDSSVAAFLEEHGPLEVENVVDALDDVFYVLDADWNFREWNARFADITGYGDDEIAEMDPLEFLPPEDRDDATAAIEATLSDETVETLQSALVTKSGERIPYEFNAAPLVDDGRVVGLVGTGRDVSERREARLALRESERRRATLLSNLPGMAYRCGNEPGWPMAFVSEGCRDLTGYEPERIERGEVSWGRDVVHPDDRDTVWEAVQDALADGDPFELTYRILTADGETRWVWEQGREMDGDDPGEPDLAGFITDVTEQRETERRLRQEKDRFRSLVQGVDEYAIFMLDPDGCVVSWNEGAERIKGYEREEILGEHFSTFYTDEDVAAGVPEENLAAAERGKAEDEGWRVRKDGSRFWANVVITALHDDDGSLRGYAKVTRDMTERRERERQLAQERDRTRQLFETSPTGILLLNRDGEVVEANDRAGEILGLAESEIVGRPYDDPAWDIVNERGDPMPPEEYPFRQVVEDGDPVYDAVLGVSRPDGDRVWLSVNATPVLDDDGSVAEVVATVTNVTERRQRERELAQQRDELATLNRINELVRGVVRSLVAAASREEIETAVCERLADSNLYRFAWVGERDLNGDVTVRSKAGDDRGFHELVSDVAGEEWERPAVTALRTDECQVVQDIPNEPGHPDDLADAASERSIRSGLAVPLTYGATTYGVLVVYATRTDAFSEREAAGFDVLGETVGFAINAIERERLLAADSVLELEFRVTDPDWLLVDLSARGDCTLVLDGTVPTSEGEILHYVRVSGADPERVAALAEDVSTVTDVGVVTDRDGNGLVAITVSTSLVTAVLDAGASVRSARAQAGEGKLVVEAPRDVDVRTLAGSLDDAFVGVELLAKRERERPVQTAGEFREELASGLTARQRATLQAAFLAGYFDWPRASTAEEVADSMDISSATFHQHLRKAQRKLASAFFGDSAT